MSAANAAASRSPKEIIILLLASIGTGGIAGLAGYLIGGYFYVLFVFPFFLLALGGVLYVAALRLFGSSSRIFNALCGLLMGLAVLAGFHYTEYVVFRSEITARIQLAQGLDKAAASRSLEALLQEKTSLGGFPGYIKYQQSQWRPYVYYVVKNGEITSSQDLVLQGKKAWLYLAGEAAVLMGGGALLGFLGARRFQRKENGRRPD